VTTENLPSLPVCVSFTQKDYLGSTLTALSKGNYLQFPGCELIGKEDPILPELPLGRLNILRAWIGEGGLEVIVGPNLGV
jgi:hypothetical protein